MDDAKNAGALVIFQTIVAVAVLAGLAISFTISFVSFIYTGALSEHLSKGIGLALLGLIVMPLVGGVVSRFPGTICQAQDVPALLLGTAAAAMVAGLGADSALAFPTVATFIAVAAILTGVALLLAGHFRLGTLARFIPYSVIGGFLAATGILLSLGGLGMIAKEEVSAWTLFPVLSTEAGVKIAPWFLFSAIVVALGRKFDSEAIIPASLGVGCVLFYAFVWASGFSLGDASEMGLLLGPFEGSNFLSGIDPSFPLQARWDLIAAQAPTLVAVVAISLLGLLLNTSGLEIEEKASINFETELKAAGFANVGAGLFGGMVGYHLLSETILARRMGLTSIFGAIGISGIAAATLWGGADIIAALPVGLMASVILILGLDLIYEWLWVQRQRLPRTDVVIILLIVLTAVTVGFLESLLFGLITAVIFFVMSYAKIDVVRLHSSGSVRRSSVERSREEMALLSEKGAAWRIYDLRDYVFFGSANGLYERLKGELTGPVSPTHLLLNFSHVSGVDSSALFALSRIQDLCHVSGAKLILTGRSAAVELQMVQADVLGDTSTFATLDDALIDIEATLLSDHGNVKSQEPQDLIGQLKAAHPGVDFAKFTSVITLAKGDVLVHEGSQSSEVFQLNDGELASQVLLSDGTQATVARFLPGALLGELAAFAEVARTATIRAATPATVTSISMKDIPQTPEGRALQADLLSQMTGYMARRLIRMTNLFRDVRF